MSRDLLRSLRLDARPPAELLDRLRAIPETEERRVWSVDAVPELPLPEGLRERLREIPVLAAEPPSWIRRPGYAVAASYLVTVLLGLAVGNPATLARETAAEITVTLPDGLTAELQEKTRAKLSDAGRGARDQFSHFSESALTSIRGSRARLATSLENTNQKFKELAGTILPQSEPEEQDAEGEPAPAKGDSNE